MIAFNMKRLKPLACSSRIFGGIASNPNVPATEPWKLNNFGLSSIEGQMWLEERFLF